MIRRRRTIIIRIRIRRNIVHIILRMIRRTRNRRIRIRRRRIK